MSQPISPELREWLVAQLAAGHSVPALRASMRAASPAIVTAVPLIATRPALV